MRAVTFATYGSIDVLQAATIPTPEVNSSEVRVRVRAVGLNPVDYLVRLGLRRTIFDITLPSGTGSDFAGEVVEVGPDVTAFAVGDQVLGSTAFAALAEFVVVNTTQVTHKPGSMSWETAGALTVAAMTAHGALNSQRVDEGDVVLVTAAAGGVGVLLSQMALAAGARVIGSASKPNHELLAKLGVIPVEYGPGMVERVRLIAPEGVSVAFDQWGDESILQALELGVSRDRINTVATDPTQFGVRRVGRPPTNGSVLEELVRSADTGGLVIPLDSVFSLANFREAFKRAESRHVSGKVVIAIDDFESESEGA